MCRRGQGRRKVFDIGATRKRWGGGSGGPPPREILAQIAHILLLQNPQDEKILIGGALAASALWWSVGHCNTFELVWQGTQTLQAPYNCKFTVSRHKNTTPRSIRTLVDLLFIETSQVLTLARIPSVTSICRPSPLLRTT